MPSPDLRAYHNLTLYDRDVRELVDRAVADALTKFPDWDPKEGNTEVALIESLSLITAEAVFAINRLPDAVVEVLMRLYGITRSLGAKATATATFNLADNLGHLIPAGTRVRLDLGGQVVDFTTDVALVVNPGNVTGTVAVTSTISTADANGAVAGTTVALVDAVPYVDTVTLATDVGAGADVEADETWRSRAVTLFSSLSSTLVNAADFTAGALQWPTVYRATTVDQWDATLSGGAGGAANGHVSVYVLGVAGATLTGPDKTNLAAMLDGKALGGLDVHVGDPTITDVAVTATVKAAAGSVGATVQAACEAALTAYLSTDTWDWSATVRRNDLIALLSNVAGVDYVVSLTAPAADVALPGAAPLASAGVLTITVT